jgi:hypothetical protein
LCAHRPTLSFCFYLFVAAERVDSDSSLSSSDSSSISSDDENDNDNDNNNDDDDDDHNATNDDETIVETPTRSVRRLKADAQLEWRDVHDDELRRLFSENDSEEHFLDIISALHVLSPTPAQGMT